MINFQNTDTFAFTVLLEGSRPFFFYEAWQAAGCYKGRVDERSLKGEQGF